MRKINNLLILLTACLCAQAATISTITCTSGVVTVNVANAGLVANQGFEITGNSVAGYNINSTAVSASASTVTWNIASCPATGAGGAIVPAQQILILSITPTANSITAQEIFWNTTTFAVACVGCTSQFASATAAQLAAIQAGTTVESVVTINVQAGTSTANMNAQVLARYAAAQSSFALGLPQFAGFCYNGVAWSASCQ